MKKVILSVATLFLAFSLNAQTIEPNYSVENEKVKVTYYHENGNVKIIGYFKDKKLSGQWTSYDLNGNKTQIAFYENGKKVGKWFVWNNDTLKEINFENNAIVSINNWKQDSRVALIINKNYQ
ncbi:MAG: nicotinic acid mononucleotide adenyltransferase [Polaribacter sp.]|nr:nicotinic acid mononucleotide adenyltransferase [Polaribacter sp.]